MILPSGPSAENITPPAPPQSQVPQASALLFSWPPQRSPPPTSTRSQSPDSNNCKTRTYSARRTPERPSPAPWQIRQPSAARAASPPPSQSPRPQNSPPQSTPAASTQIDSPRAPESSAHQT